MEQTHDTRRKKRHDRDTAVVMFVLATATFYGWMLTRLRIPQAILEHLVLVTKNPYLIITLMILFVPRLFLGR